MRTYCIAQGLLLNALCDLNGNSERLYFLGLQNGGDWSHEIKRGLLLEEKILTKTLSLNERIWEGVFGS